MSDKRKLERQKVFCKYCGKEMTAENEVAFHLILSYEPKAEVCCNECLPIEPGHTFSIPEARSLRITFGHAGINGIDYPYEEIPGTTPEEFDRLEYEHEEKIIEYATRDRSYVDDWDGDDEEER